MAVDIVAENQLAGEDSSQVSIAGAGDTDNLGFAREFSVNVGDIVEFSCHGSGTVLDIYRLGFYGGAGWHKVTTLTNTATTQPDPQTVPDSNGGTTCTQWSVTATWTVPPTATSGLYVGVYRNAALNNASYIPFVVRDDDAEVDIIVKTSDSTWALAYNFYGTPASPLTGKSVYGSGGALGDITTRSYHATYHKPIVTREGVVQTYWRNAEYPMMRFLERNGYTMKYISCQDMDRTPQILDKGKVFLSHGHDEYWSQNMWDEAERFRDAGGHLLFASGNEVFWRVRYDGDSMWCYKDTMPGPETHVAGTPLDPVSWTGTWKDTRWADRTPENLLTGTDFRMNGVVNFDAVVRTQEGQHPVWQGTDALTSDVTVVGVIGFEADRFLPARPEASFKVLAQTNLNIDGRYANDDGQTYDGNGTLVWGIVAQRYPSGGVVVGFGTVQWAWALDAVHDRDTVPVNAAAQQMTVTLLNDLGAGPNSLMAGLTLYPANNLDVYGGTGVTSLIERGDGVTLIPYLWDGSTLTGLNLHT